MLIFDFLDQDFLLLNLKIFSQFYFFPKAIPHFNLLICQISLLIEMSSGNLKKNSDVTPPTFCNVT
jgi:hypothetical protein